MVGKSIAIIIIVCILLTVWSACVIGARADEQLREIAYDEKGTERKEKDMAIQRTCDRCGMPTGSTYYKIDIYAKSDAPLAETEALAHNLWKSIEGMNNQEAVYCKECKNKIEQYMRMDISRVIRESKIRRRPKVEKSPKKGE